MDCVCGKYGFGLGLLVVAGARARGAGEDGIVGYIDSVVDFIVAL